MNKKDFLERLRTDEISPIVYLCVEHMIDKIYKDDESFEAKEIEEFLANYKNYHRYLNDFAGTIYNRHGSHVNQIYIDMCEYLDVDVDNKYTLEHTIMKLEKQTPELLLGLTNEEIQHQTVEHFDEKLEAIEGSTHYINNKAEFSKRVDKLYNNITLVKSALNITN